MDRPPGIYASSLSRRDLARRRARMRGPLALRLGGYACAGVLVAVVAALAERLMA
jgi:hypothetical protein